jgi:peptide/nickel transport system permease protein
MHLGAATASRKEVNPRGTSQAGVFWTRFCKQRGSLIVLTVLALMLAGTIVVPMISPFEALHRGNDPNMWRIPINPNPDMWHAPVATYDPSTGLTYWLGTDFLGRDLLTRLFLGGRITLLVALGAAIAATALGILIGGIAGFYGGWIDTVFMRFTDFVLAWPLFALYILSIQFLKGGVPSLELQTNVAITLSSVGVGYVLFSWMGVARLVRSNFLSLRSQPFVEATRALGASNFRIIFKHLLPNCTAAILVSFTLIVGDFILWEAILAYFGQGVSDPPAVTLGTLFASSTEYIWFVRQANPFEEIRFFLFLFPCIMILITVLALTYLADALRNAMDPTHV